MNSARKLLVVDLMDWMQNGMSCDGKCLRWKRKARSKMSSYPDIVAV